MLFDLLAALIVIAIVFVIARLFIAVAKPGEPIVPIVWGIATVISLVILLSVILGRFSVDAWLN